jgi:3-oxoacyl-[acyl-carrier protein] reductase
MARTAIVTGGSRGIGRAIAKRLAQDGFAVAVGYAGNAAGADGVVGEIEAAGGRALALRADVGMEADVAQLFARAREAFGGIDVVVNSAGIMQLAPISEGNLEAFDKTIATNLRGSFLVLSRAAREVGAGGRIIALSTSVLGLALPAYGAYIASKAGVEGLVRVLANELRGKSVTVNAVAPGPTATELFLHGKSDEVVERMRKMNPLERLGQPEDIAAVVAFLAGKDGAWVNGQVLRANGGMV